MLFSGGSWVRTADWNSESCVAPVARDQLNFVNLQPHDCVPDGFQAAEGHHSACAVDGTEGRRCVGTTEGKSRLWDDKRPQIHDS